MKIRLAIAAALACTMTTVLAACGGGDGPTINQSELEQVRQDPRVVRLGGIIERANTLVIPAAYYDFTLTAQGLTEHVFLPMRGSCRGTSCTLRGGGESIATTLDDLLNPTSETDVTGITLGSRQGFDTVHATARSRINEEFYGDSTAASVNAQSYGIWGRYGFATADVIEGPFSGTSQGIAFRGNLRGAQSSTVGTPTGSNPTGLGSASWSGPVEAISTRNWSRRSGTTTITMADLSVPRVVVDVSIGGYSIGSSGWQSIWLHNGRFETGAAGVDRLIGNFHGPRHEEAYGAFDTGAYVGAFGALRE